MAALMDDDGFLAAKFNHFKNLVCKIPRINFKPNSLAHHCL